MEQWLEPKKETCFFILYRKEHKHSGISYVALLPRTLRLYLKHASVSSLRIPTDNKESKYEINKI